MKSVSDKSCRDNRNTHFVSNNFSLPTTPLPENRAVYEIMWKKFCRGGAGHRWQYGACALHAV